MTALLQRLEGAAQEGIAPNLSRFLTFLGWQEGEPLELQALQVPPDRSAGRWKGADCMAARSTSLATLTALASEADTFHAQGVYVLFNRIKPAVLHKREVDAWFDVPKGKGTADKDVAQRRALYFDLDPEREDGVKDISATDEERERAFERADALLALLQRLLPADCLGFGSSGNGCAVYVALEPTTPADSDALVREALHLADALLTDERVTVDTTVSDPRRICPAFGTVKRKGGHSAERPHRRSAFVAHDAPRRLTLDELRAFVAGLRAQLTDEQRAAVDAALNTSKGRPAQSSPSTKGKARQATHHDSEPGEDAFKVANAIPVEDVLARLGLWEDGHPICPGCREGGDSSRAVVRNGFKCSHDRCSTKGYGKGFRPVVDLVLEAQGFSRSVDALDWLRAEFPHAGIPERRASSRQGTAPTSPEVPDKDEPTPFVPLESPRALPGFPVAALPPVVGRFVAQLATYLECPVDLPACLALGALASVAMKRYAASPRVGWEEPLNLYLAVALPPGESKSPAFKQVFAPLYAAQKAQVQAWKEECARVQERNAAKGRGESDELPPMRPRLFVDDATPEKIGVVLEEQKERITLASDEGTAFQQMTGLYAKNGQANVGVFLKGHDGGHYVVDRMGRPSIHLEAPLMTVALAVQPTVIRELGKRPELRDRGLWGRFAYAFPASRVGTHTYNTPPVEDHVSTAWGELLTGLAALPVPDAADVLRFTPEAWERLRGAMEDISRAQLPGGTLSSVCDWASKLRGLLTRLSGLLHVASAPAGEAARHRVSLATVEDALAIGRYFMAHALYAFDVEMTLDPVEQAARLAWEAIERKGAERVRAGELSAWVRALRKGADASAALEHLVARGYLRREGGRGRGYVRVRHEAPEVEPLTGADGRCQSADASLTDENEQESLENTYGTPFVPPSADTADAPVSGQRPGVAQVPPWPPATGAPRQQRQRVSETQKPAEKPPSAVSAGRQQASAASATVSGPPPSAAQPPHEPDAAAPPDDEDFDPALLGVFPKAGAA